MEQGHHPMTDKPKVTQATDAAREAAAMYADADGEYYADPDNRAEYCRAVRAGELDGDMLVQAFENLYRIAAEQSQDDVIEEACKLLELETLKLAPETLTFDAPMQLEKIAVKIGKAAGIFHAVKLLRDNAERLRNLKDSQPTKQSRDVIKAAKRQADNVAFILNRVDLPEHDRQRLERELAEDRDTLSKGRK